MMSVVKTGVKYVYRFDEGNAGMVNLLGGKGANLAEMKSLGLPVPNGFIISTEACRAYMKEGVGLLDQLWPKIVEHMHYLEHVSGKTFGGEENPLLVSVRSGAPISMPGMMDTILNLGLNDRTVLALTENTRDPRFAHDCYRRFIQMFANVVLGIDLDHFEKVLSEHKKQLNIKFDHQIPEENLAKIISRFKEIVKSESGEPFPQDPWAQLKMAIEAVFRSWNNKRAVTYRKIANIPDDLGTAVTVMEMVFGNLGSDCGTGVLFSRNPSTGDKELFGEFLINAQGEDVVAGIRTPQPIGALKEVSPHIYEELKIVAEKLERHFKDMQDIEFTVERGKLYILQTRNGKRTAKAAVRIASEMVKEGIIDARTAVTRVTPKEIEQLLHRQVDPSADLSSIAEGIAASPGAATGKVVFDVDEAEERGKRGEPVILVRPETTPEDIHGLSRAAGLLTSRGGQTSHAALVARSLGIPCVVGCEAVNIDLIGERFTVGEFTVKKDDVITIDGTSGKVYPGEVPLIEPSMHEEYLHHFLDRADMFARLQVWANCDTPEEARQARKLGAKGVGLCRTEHMFRESDRLSIMQQVIVAEKVEDRMDALEKLARLQKDDFVEIFEVMQGLPVIVRLLDPPLNEFLPKGKDVAKKLAQLRSEGRGESPEAQRLEILLKRIEGLQEGNPMLGFRGCRIGVLYPEIYEAQAKAIAQAACELIKRGVDVKVKIMVPLVATGQEMCMLRANIEKAVAEIAESYGENWRCKIGTMIELPRAAIVADEIAEYADFFSFGTNDLTQTTLGVSRDDAEGKFLAAYVRLGIYTEDPFRTLDRKGVGALMKMAVEKGRSAKKDLELGICGEHGGDPSSIAFCDRIGLDYVSCSAMRIPVARLSAAHSSLGLLN
jgi:pyruvate,orthophosphate dikinase